MMTSVRMFLDAQTPAVRAVLIAFFGALAAALVGFIAEYFELTFVFGVSVLAVGAFVFRAVWAMTFLPNRGGTGQRDT